MKKSLSFIFILFMILGVAVAKDRTLQDYYSKPEIKAQLDAVMEQLDAYDQTMNYSYKVKGNTMTYIYKFTFQLDDVSTAKETFDAYFSDELISIMKTALQEESGVKDVHLQYIYYNNDGSEIYNRTW